MRSAIKNVLRRGATTFATSSGRNAAISSASAIVNPLVQLAATPVLFSYLGAEWFGIWVLSNSLLAVSSVFSFGFGEAATKYIALYRTRNDVLGVIRVIQNVLALNIVFGLILSVIAWHGARILGEGVFRLSGDSLTTAVAMMKIISVGIFIRFIYAVLESALRGYERYDIEAILSSAGNISTTVFAVVLAVFGFDLQAIVASSVLILILLIFILVAILRRMIGSLAFLAVRLMRKTVNELASFGIYTWLQNLVGLLYQQTDRWIVAGMLGPAQMSYYVICLQVIHAGHSVVSRGSAFIFPMSVRLSAANARDAIWKTFRGAMTITTMAAVFLSAIYVCFGDFILTAWMGNEFAAYAHSIFIVFAVWNAFFLSGVVPYYLMNGCGHERLNTIFGAISLITFLAGLALLIPRFGVIGAAYARLLSMIPSLILRGFLVRYLFSLSGVFYGLLTLLPQSIIWLPLGFFLFRAKDSQIYPDWGEVTVFCAMILAGLSVFLVYWRLLPAAITRQRMSVASM